MRSKLTLTRLGSDTDLLLLAFPKPSEDVRYQRNSDQGAVAVLASLRTEIKDRV